MRSSCMIVGRALDPPGLSMQLRISRFMSAGKCEPGPYPSSRRPSRATAEHVGTSRALVSLGLIEGIVCELVKFYVNIM